LPQKKQKKPELLIFVMCDLSLVKPIARGGFTKQ